jgi:hypothetical protein
MPMDRHLASARAPPRTAHVRSPPTGNGHARLPRHAAASPPSPPPTVAAAHRPPPPAAASPVPASSAPPATPRGAPPPPPLVPAAMPHPAAIRLVVPSLPRPESDTAVSPPVDEGGGGTEGVDNERGTSRGWGTAGGRRGGGYGPYRRQRRRGGGRRPVNDVHRRTVVPQGYQPRASRHCMHPRHHGSSLLLVLPRTSLRGHCLLRMCHHRV